jgi:hypothetical protein
MKQPLAPGKELAALFALYRKVLVVIVDHHAGLGSGRNGPQVIDLGPEQKKNQKTGASLGSSH